MKKLLLLITGTLFFSSLYAQDIITLKNGTQLKGNVTDVNTTAIKYKKAGSPDTATYVIQKSDVLVIDYKDGSTLIFNNLTPADQGKPSENFPQRVFFSIGGCIDVQSPFEQYQVSRVPTKIDFYPTLGLGVTLSRRVKLGIEADYQVINYNSSEREPLTIISQNKSLPDYTVLSATQYSINSYNNAITNMFLIPNVIITANQHKFTPYAKMGAILALLNKNAFSFNSVQYNNGVVTTGTPYESTSNNPVTVGLLLAGGSTLKLSKHFSVFAELYVKSIMDFNGLDPVSFGISSGAVGLNAGLNIAL